LRPSAGRTIPAAGVPPIISMPMVTSMGTGDSPGGGSYGSAATTANGTSNNRTPLWPKDSVDGSVPASESRINNSESFRIWSSFFDAAGGCSTGRGLPRSWSDLSLGGFAGISLGSGRTHRTRGSYGPRRTCRSRRYGKAAVFYHYFSFILSGGDLDYASGRKLRSNPTEPSSRSAVDLYCFGWTDFNMDDVLARSPNPSDNCQFATRYGGSRDKYFCTRTSTPRDHTSN
jgi:hypothetical protein